VREGLGIRFTDIPNVLYASDDHFVAGDRGASEWTMSGTTTDGDPVDVCGCDLWTFRDGLIVRKTSFWKVRVA
jgi:ketosteroid isomerase-like protein